MKQLFLPAIVLGSIAHASNSFDYSSFAGQGFGAYGLFGIANSISDAKGLNQSLIQVGMGVLIPAGFHGGFLLGFNPQEQQTLVQVADFEFEQYKESTRQMFFDFGWAVQLSDWTEIGLSGFLGNTETLRKGISSNDGKYTQGWRLHAGLRGLAFQGTWAWVDEIPQFSFGLIAPLGFRAGER